jgi:hypothetical protein
LLKIVQDFNTIQLERLVGRHLLTRCLFLQLSKFLFDDHFDHLLSLVDFGLLFLPLVHVERAAQHNLDLIIRLLQYCRQLDANLVSQPLQFGIPLLYYLDKLVDFLLK